MSRIFRRTDDGDDVSESLVQGEEIKSMYTHGAHTYIHTCTYTHIRTYIHTCTYTYTHIHTCKFFIGG